MFDRIRISFIAGGAMIQTIKLPINIKDTKTLSALFLTLCQQNRGRRRGIEHPILTIQQRKLLEIACRRQQNMSYTNE